jgi:serine/threonine protein kinase
MEPERWRQIKDAFSAALELPAEERAEWLAVTIPDDPSLAREVAGLLAAHDGATDFYDRGALAAVPEVQRQLAGGVEGMRVGPYRVLSELGHGGMGAVYLAVRDPASFTHKVALKLIKRGMDSDEIVRRFVAERQILASLAHPNIARLFDGGSTPDGRPYFVMEYVEGKPITVYAGEHELAVEARLHLFLHVCRAVQHAHQSLVVHRDLKPANILVDADGEPKLLDFGIAKLLDPSSSDGTTALTGLAPGPMTPDYAAPEQLAGGAVTTATDVYGLGLLLYELLVGQNPRSAGRKLGEGWSGRPPSQALKALAPEKNTETRRRIRRVAGDLDTIVGKALAPEPERRYGTAAALAEDVERHLTQRPVAARRPTLAYRLSRSVLRHKLAAALALAVCLFGIVSSYEAFVVRQERDRAEEQRRRAESLNQFLQRMIQRADPEQSRGETLTLRQVLDSGARELMVREAGQDARTWAELLETMGVTYKNLGLYEDSGRYLERALRQRERQRRPSREADLETADNWTLLGQVTFQQKNYAASRSAYRRALAIKRRWLGPAALPLVRDWNGLALIALDEGQTDAAESDLARALAISRAAANGQRELAETYNVRGRLELLRGRSARAQIFLGAAWRYLRATLGDDHPDTVDTRSNLAVALSNNGQYAEAETLFQEIVRTRRRLGADHPDLASALLYLAIVQQQLRHLEAARLTLDEVLRMRREYRFPPDEDAGEAWNLLGYVDLYENRLADADEAFRKSFATYRSLPGEHRADLARILDSQAEVRRRTDPAGAVALARRGLDLTRAAKPDNRPLVGGSLEFLAELLQEAGKLRSAEIAYRQAMNLLAGPEWARHPNKARAEIGLGSLLVETARAREALPYLEDGLRLRRQSRSAQDFETAKAESELGACYAALGDGRAPLLLQHGYQVLLARQGAEHPDTRRALDHLRRLDPSRG